jgi:GrpB-like predicted nucleotidyltransferase (UPF0157 family)
MLGLKNDIVELQPHNPKWKLLFKQEKKKILSFNQENIVQIEHIGSTAVPGLISKPIIDIMIGVKKYSNLGNCVFKLGDIGYKCFDECRRPGRLFFVKGRPFESSHHLHLVEYGSNYWNNNILFRNILLNYDNVTNEYAKLKIELAKRYRDNRNAYRIYKSVFVKKILKKYNEFENIDQLQIT